MYIYHPYLLDKAQNSQPCSSCGLPSFRRPLPFGLRGFLKISEAFAVAQLTPGNHNRFSSVSGLGTWRCTADPDSTIPSAVALGQKGKIFVMGFPISSPCGKSGLLPLSPSPGLSSRAETTLLNKLAFLSTTTGRFCSRCHVFRLPFLTCRYRIPYALAKITEKKLRTWLFLKFPPWGRFCAGRKNLKHCPISRLQYPETIVIIYYDCEKVYLNTAVASVNGVRAMPRPAL